MKATGIIRRIDDLGRVVIPKEVRRTLRVREGDPLEIYLENDGIIFKKYSPLALGQNVDAACKALKKEGFRFAIYDTSGIVKENGHGEFQQILPEGWLEHRTFFADGNKTVYPIVTDGDLVGYIAISHVVATTEQSKYVSAVVTMIAADLSTY